VDVKRFLSAGVALALVLGVLVAAGCSPSAPTKSSAPSPSGTSEAFKGVPLVGAGATFPQPVYAQWTQAFNKVETDAKINYQGIGSGGGIQQFTAKTVDFGATDVPLKAAEAAKITAPYVMFPTCLGAVVISYNLEGISSPLKFDGKTAADIFLGKIQKWNDPAIAALNPGVTLPGDSIQVVHRADGSGTTKIFTGWLKKQSPEWASKVGADKSVQWPTGQGGNGNAGVAAAMKQTKGSIGYMESQYAATTGLGVASIKAPDGNFVEPTLDSVSKAAESLAFPITEKTNILDSNLAGAYPIASTTYILVYKDQTDKDKAQTLVDFWTWALTKGQSQLQALNYAPLPQKVQTDAMAQVSEITANGTAVTPSQAVK
jgi:phosphate transport system substrate-binding protein